MQKICSKCLAVRSVDDFYRRTGGGLFGVCKPCQIEYGRRWQTANAGRVRDLQRRRYRVLAAASRSMPRVWYPGVFCGPRKPKPKIKRSERFAGPPKPPIEVLIGRNWLGLQIVLWAKIFERKEKRREFERLRRRRYGEGHRRKSKVAFLLSSQRGLCAVCRSKLGDMFDVDHITPKSAGGGNEVTNLQLLCRPCNLAKSDKHPVAFMQSRGYLL